MDRSKAFFWNLVEPEHVRARAFCRKLMNNREDGDDLYQDSLVSALTRFENLREIKSFRAWLYRIIVNGYTDRMRRPWWRRQSPERIPDDFVGENPLPVQAARRRLEIAFKAVSSEDRALITLFEIQGWSIAELAAMNGRSEASIKMRLSRARRRMRRALMKYFAQANPVKRKGTIESKDQVCVATKPVKD